MTPGRPLRRPKMRRPDPLDKLRERKYFLAVKDQMIFNVEDIIDNYMAKGNLPTSVMDDMVNVSNLLAEVNRRIQEASRNQVVDYRNCPGMSVAHGTSSAMLQMRLHSLKEHLLDILTRGRR